MARKLITLLHPPSTPLLQAMNAFVCRAGVGQPAIPIDFQWTAIGLGMLDVAMHINHSVEPALLRNGGEEELLRWYLAQFHSELGTRSPAYDAETSRFHYTLALLDYARVVFSHFWKGLDGAKLAAKAGNSNCSNAYRSLPGLLRFAEAVDRELVAFESRKAAGSA